MKLPPPLAALERALHEQFAVEHALAREGPATSGKLRADVVAGAAVEPGLAAGMDELDPDAVPFPFGRIIVERDPQLLERMGEHERPEDRDVLGGRLARPRPSAQSKIGT